MKVLGICGSPRKGATEWSVKKALEVLEGYPGIETVYWSVRGKKIGPCIHCDRCIRENSMCTIQDDYKEVEALILEADAILVGSPVYDMNVTGQLAMVFNRTRPHYLVHAGGLKNKVGAALSVGGTRHGGQEMTNMAIINFFLMHEMLVTGGLGGCYNGGTVWSRDDRVAGAEKDGPGADTVIRLAQGMAEAVITIEHGRKTAYEIMEKAEKLQGSNSPIRDH